LYGFPNRGEGGAGDREQGKQAEKGSGEE